MSPPNGHGEVTGGSDGPRKRRPKTSAPINTTLRKIATSVQDGQKTLNMYKRKTNERFDCVDKDVNGVRGEVSQVRETTTNLEHEVVELRQLVGQLVQGGTPAGQRVTFSAAVEQHVTPATKKRTPATKTHRTTATKKRAPVTKTHRTTATKKRAPAAKKEDIHATEKKQRTQANLPPSGRQLGSPIVPRNMFGDSPVGSPIVKLRASAATTGKESHMAPRADFEEAAASGEEEQQCDGDTCGLRRSGRKKVNPNQRKFRGPKFIEDETTGEMRPCRRCVDYPQDETGRCEKHTLEQD